MTITNLEPVVMVAEAKDVELVPKRKHIRDTFRW